MSLATSTRSLPLRRLASTAPTKIEADAIATGEQKEEVSTSKDMLLKDAPTIKPPYYRKVRVVGWYSVSSRVVL